MRTSCAKVSDRDITVFGNGNQTRSFCYVDDLIEGIFRMMNNNDGFIGPVNLGNPTEFTILELAEQVIRLTGSSSKIVFKPLPADDPTQRRPNIDLARRKLGWQPTIELEEGLNRTISYFERVSLIVKAFHCEAIAGFSRASRRAERPMQQNDPASAAVCASLRVSATK